VIPLTHAIPEHIRGGLRQCAAQIDVYFTYQLTLLQAEFQHTSGFQR